MTLQPLSPMKILIKRFLDYKTLKMKTEKMNSLLEELEQIQNPLLLLEKEKVYPVMKSWYLKSIKFFSDFYLNYENLKKGEPGFLLKSQCNLVLKHLSAQNKQLGYLPKMSENEIIRLFEKQIKLKKIIRQLSGHLV